MQVKKMQEWFTNFISLINLYLLVPYLSALETHLILIALKSSAVLSGDFLVEIAQMIR